ncbi:hypothetical protein C3432_01880 [Citrobacter amalonaticus]|uniref:IpaD/SipD/SspD family type III secretion system needle tip protein n=1 Tax=Citrobacter amalonaticus TaxID=35703 RepID=A0A2S4S2I7_CITAM|nr:IpaD/SipD/SspD family type III secretion system needle tip protein [Citrobacter amalonaticus]POT59496.1 hypothetical protein C3432_01880 [Citrobacter amalonaticus]POT77626.1 hypothetical protein C3436_09550 [Citrobacter amalonaticus]POU68078.1 hypothetical protein C3430_03085 [Citrobacter amalonaticus]POV07682.1 hypothetical protein C3424_03095 [Citrobacter amalonaticus]
MTMTTGLNVGRQAFFSNATNGKEANAAAAEVSKQTSVNNINQVCEKLASDLQTYAQNWRASQQSLGVMIDTTPAQTVLKAAQPLLASSGNNPQKYSDDVLTDWEIYDEVCKALGYMQTNYMDIYAQVTEQYQLYMQDVNSFKASLTNNMSSSDDEIKLNIPAIKTEINKVINKWSTTPILTVDTKEKAEYWQEQLGLPYSQTGGGYSFYANLAPMYDILNSTSQLPSSVSTARFNQWQNGVNSSCSTIESDTQIIAQKYSQANTVFNNLAKILSSTMDALYQTDKEFLR